MPIEINRELKDINKLKEDRFRSAISKQLPALINTLEITNKLVVLSYLTPLLISEGGTTLGE